MRHPENVVGWIVWGAGVALLTVAALTSHGCASSASSPSAACTAVRTAQAAAELAEPYVCEMDGGRP